MRLRLRLRTNPGLRAPATTLRSSRGTGRVGVDTYLSRCRHGRASRVLRAGVLVCGRWGVLDGGLGRCGRVVYGMRSCAAGYLVSVVPSSSFSVFLAPAVRALCPSSCRHHPPLRFSHAALCRPPGSLAARTACGRVRRAPLVPVFFVCRRRLLRRLRARRRSPCAWLLVIPSSRAAPPVRPLDVCIN